MVSRIIVVAGVTCSGKSAYAVQLAKQLSQAVIINADASQLYNELKILTAYPTQQDMEAVPHKLFGILSPYEKSSVGQWLDRVEKELSQLEDSTAIICGGTGFYIDAFINGIAKIPDIPKAFREQVYTEFETIGREAFYQKLRTLDPDIKLHPNDTQRILRAYEVITYTGKTQREWWNLHRQSPRKVEMTVLIPDREELRQRCHTRLENMLKNGLLEEVHDFMKRYPNYIGPLRSVIGFNEAIKAINHEISKNELIEITLRKTMQYAKRQVTWLGRGRYPLR